MNLFENLLSLNESDENKTYEVKYNPNINDTTTLYKEMQRMLADAGLDDTHIKLDDLFNCFNIDKLKELYDYISSEYETEDYNDLNESKKLKVESMDGIEVSRITEYIRDALDSLESYIDKNGAIPNNIAHTLGKIYTLIDEIYEFTSSINEATSGIGAGAYTTKAIDMLPAGVKKIKESLYDEYLERVMDEKSNVELVKILNEIKNHKELKTEDKKKLEKEIRTKVKAIKTEAITEFYGKSFDDEVIKDKIEFTKNNPDAYMSLKYLETINYSDKLYYLISESNFIVFDNKECAVYLATDEELNKYLMYFEYKIVDNSDGDSENGMHDPEIEESEVPYKVVEV